MAYEFDKKKESEEKNTAKDSGERSAAGAWAQGHDVYFGRGGFEPAVAAHELVHTVQQGAVKGNVSRSVPAGAVQLLPEDEEDGKKIKKEDAAPQNGPQDQNPGKNASSEILSIEQGLMKFFATETACSCTAISRGNSDPC